MVRIFYALFLFIIPVGLAFVSICPSRASGFPAMESSNFKPNGPRSEIQSLSLETILQANDASSLKLTVQKAKKKAFLKILCEKQKEKNKVPAACYELSFNADVQCRQLKLKDLKLSDVEKALKSKFLSSSCRKRLEEKKRIFLYRQKDFLIPELKKHWTESKVFF